MIRWAKAVLIVIAIMLPITAQADIAANLVIMQDIGSYKFMGKGGGAGPGFIGATGHFSPDHTDVSYGALYFNDPLELGVKVEVSQHAGVDSDKWLLHELDVDFRNYYGIPGGSYAIVPIDGNYVLEFGSAGWDYRWVSGNKVIKISYHDRQMTKPEPQEIVKAYFAKHPSTIPATTLSQLRSTDSKTKWIKDEMDRRLWLADKWFGQIQTADPKLREKLKSMTDSMVVFLNYREKYYDVASRKEKIALETELSQDNVSAVQAKLKGYKAWWTAHKDDSITLP